VKFRKYDRRTRNWAIAARMVQVGRFCVPSYQNATGDYSDREDCYIHGRPRETRDGYVIVTVFVKDPEITTEDRFKMRTIRIDRIIKTAGVYFYAVGRKFKSFRERKARIERIIPAHTIKPVMIPEVGF